MGSWFWLNIPLCAMIFSAVVGIPLWMVFKHPDTGEEITATAARVRDLPLAAVSMTETDRWRSTEALRAPASPADEIEQYLARQRETIGARGR
jgi:hypothetical protein